MLLLAIVLGALSRGVTEPVDANAPADAFSAERAAAAAAPAGDLTDLGDGRVRIELHSPREATRLDLEVTSGALQDVTIDGTAWGSGQSLTSLRIVGVRPDQRVVIEGRLGTGAALGLTDVTFDLEQAGGWTAPPEGVSVVGPEVRVRATIER